MVKLTGWKQVVVMGSVLVACLVLGSGLGERSAWGQGSDRCKETGGPLNQQINLIISHGDGTEVPANEEYDPG
jgi:hypothetical protein